MEKTIKKLHQAFHIAAVSVVAIAFTVVVVQAATTIGSNITTGGTISAYSGLFASNNASSTQLTATTTLFVGANANGLVLTDGSILDGSGAITFGDENITFGGTIVNWAGLVSFNNASSTFLSATTTLFVGADATGLVISNGSILDGSGEISFGDENLTTTGNLAFATASSTGAVKFPTITSDTGSISFGDENLTTTGNIAMATASSTGLVKLNTAQISGTGDVMSDIQFGTCTVTLGAFTASTTSVVDCAATGVTTSHRVFVTPHLSNPGFILQSASSTADNVIQIGVFNGTSYSDINPIDNAWDWMAIK